MNAGSRTLAWGIGSVQPAENPDQKQDGNGHAKQPKQKITSHDSILRVVNSIRTILAVRSSFFLDFFRERR